MQLINRSGLPTEAFTALDTRGREHLVVVAKATYRFGEGRAPELSENPKPIAVTDVFVGEPGYSAPLYEADLVHRKQRCDVLLAATAHAPEGKAVTELPVAVRVGALTKQFLVVGDRHWRRGAMTASASSPKPFTSIPIHYGRAFGGSPPRDGKPGSTEVSAYMANPVGVGYSPSASAEIVDGMPLPNTEDYREPVTTPAGKYRPLAFGPIGRSWDPRRAHAGTYDAAWRAKAFPLLPADFDDAYFQAAPADQQIAHPKGGEQVALQHLVPGRPLVTFELPRLELLAKVLRRSHEVTELQTVVDTLFFEPDEGVFTLVYRASMPLDRQSLSGIKIVATGPICKKWWSSKMYGTADCGCNGDTSNDPVARDEHEHEHEHEDEDDEAVPTDPVTELLGLTPGEDGVYHA